jgi:hypothetical protein
VLVSEERTSIQVFQLEFLTFLTSGVISALITIWRNSVLRYFSARQWGVKTQNWLAEKVCILFVTVLSNSLLYFSADDILFLHYMGTAFCVPCMLGDGQWTEAELSCIVAWISGAWFVQSVEQVECLSDQWTWSPFFGPWIQISTDGEIWPLALSSHVVNLLGVGLLPYCCLPSTLACFLSLPLSSPFMSIVSEAQGHCLGTLGAKRFILIPKQFLASLYCS